MSLPGGPTVAQSQIVTVSGLPHINGISEKTNGGLTVCVLVSGHASLASRYIVAAQGQVEGVHARSVDLVGVGCIGRVLLKQR